MLQERLYVVIHRNIFEMKRLLNLCISFKKCLSMNFKHFQKKHARSVAMIFHRLKMFIAVIAGLLQIQKVFIVTIEAVVEKWINVLGLDLQQYVNLQPKDDPRRYQWIKSTNGWYGPKEKCQGKEQVIENSISGLYNCDNCICHCTEDRPDATSIRTLSLRPQFSNISSNMVVTGVRFIEKDKVIHIQIQQGELMKEAEIDNSTFEWIEVEDFEYISNESAGIFYKLEEDNKIPLVEGKDYALFGSKQRTLHLDEVIAPIDMIITGVRLNHIDSQKSEKLNTSPIHLEIQITKYEYESGKLNETLSRWITSETMPYPSVDYDRDRIEILLTRSDNPTKFYSNIPSDETNLLIKFRATDVWKDAAQTVVPLFDIQPVTSPVRPLDGIGIIHKTTDNSGGFISLKIFTVNCAHHLRYISEDDIELYKTIANHEMFSYESYHHDPSDHFHYNYDN